jgi:hypothetical protein
LVVSLALSDIFCSRSTNRRFALQPDSIGFGIA